MKEINLVKCGKDIVQTLVTYLAKDAIGREFLKVYLKSREEQEEAAGIQRKAMDDLKEGTKAMGEKTGEISENAEKNIQRLDEISYAIKHLQDSVNKIDEEQKHYAEQFKSLIEQTRMISNQVDDIQNISQQTRILSFNASIEAARAGEAGKGFRVIAGEVKSLSDNTTQSSEEIKKNTNSLIDSIKKLENLTKKNSGDLQSLVDETKSTIQQFENVKQVNTKNNQNVGDVSELVNENIEKIDNVLESIGNVEKTSGQSVQLFADCASKNEMLFNDLYSFAYELKAIFEDMENAGSISENQ